MLIFKNNKYSVEVRKKQSKHDKSDSQGITKIAKGFHQAFCPYHPMLKYIFMSCKAQ